MLRTSPTTNRAAPARAGRADDDTLRKRHRSTQENSVDSFNNDSHAVVTCGSTFSNLAHQGQTCNRFTTSNKSNIKGSEFAKQLPPHRREGLQGLTQIFQATDGGLLDKISSHGHGAHCNWSFLARSVRCPTSFPVAHRSASAFPPRRVHIYARSSPPSSTT